MVDVIVAAGPPVVEVGVGLQGSSSCQCSSSQDLVSHSNIRSTWAQQLLSIRSNPRSNSKVFG